MSAGLIGEENTYVCLEPEIAMGCDKLSNVNAHGTQTRCYYESPELNRTTYRVCKMGWIKYTLNKQEIINQSGVLCKVYNQNKLIKECLTDNNETFIYIIS